MNWNKTLAAFTIISFIVLIVPVAPATSQSEGPVVAYGGATEFTTTVTLITGDTLEVTRLEDGRYTISVASRSGAFQTINNGEDTYVIPDGVEQLIGDILDMELFNIDYLVENGYSDTEMTTIPVIIEYSTNPGREHAKINTAPGLLKKHDFETVYASSFEITKEEANAFANATFYTEGGLEGVKKIWLDRKVELSLDESVPGIGAPYAWDLGYDGSGIKIAIIDTGIWKDHPDLKGKVIAEKDFTDDGTPMDLFGHGTHCAGIAAANGALKGVAPGASLINAKALNKQGSGYMSWVMAAWEWAATQGANVFSMSFGTSPTDGTAPWDIELNTIVDTYNIVAVVAAGNAYDYYNIASPAAADNAIAVGATTKPGVAKLSVVSPEVKDLQANLFEYSPKPPVEGIEKPIVYAGLGSAEEFAKVDVAGKIALIKRGVYTFRDKVINAANAGAVAAIIFNNVPRNFMGSLGTPVAIPAVSISLEDGTYLLGLLEKGEVIVNLRWDIKTFAMASFSSRGPRLDNAVKPEIVAPGVAIKSTVPTYPCKYWDPSGYMLMSGTSMATPHVAGAAALLLQKHPDWSWTQIRDALMSTAKINVLDFYIYPKPIADIYTQGSGVIAVNAAMDVSVVFEPAEISFGIIPVELWRTNPLQSRSLTIRNYGDHDVTLELNAEKVHDQTGNTFDIATLDKYTVTIPAGGIETITLTIDLTTPPVNTPLGGRVIAKNADIGEEIHAIFGIYKEQKHNLTIKAIDPEGNPLVGTFACIFEAVASSLTLNKNWFNMATDSNGEIKMRLPETYWNIFSLSILDAPAGEEYPTGTYEYFVPEYELLLNEDKTVVLDTRNAEPVILDLQIEPTVPVETFVVMFYENKDGKMLFSLGRGTGPGAYPATRPKYHILPGAPSLGKVYMLLRFTEARGTSSSDVFPIEKTTAIYDFAYTMVGEITTPITYTVDDTTLQQMALVKAKHFSTDINPIVRTWTLPGFPTEWYTGAVLSLVHQYLTPIERDEYLTPNKLLYLHRMQMDFCDYPGKVYGAGERTERTWLEQPVKLWTALAKRTSNYIEVGGYPTDTSGNIPYITAIIPYTIPTGLFTFTMKVYKDDSLIGTYSTYSWKYTVTPEEANYRMELYSKNIPRWSSYSVETFTTIRFKSKYVEGTETLPIINLNYKIPGLRVNNVKVVSKKDPLVIQIIPQSLKGLDISQVRFWYSYDDGATWTEVGEVVKGTDNWIVKPEYEGENYISIKTLVTDVEGNSVEQKIMRAFFVTTKPQNFWFDQP
jgi:subtilisin family serine protease